MIVNSCYFLVVVLCVSVLWYLLVWDYLLSVFSGVCLVSLAWIVPSNAFCRAGFVDRYCLNLVLSWNVLFTPSMLIESFAGYISLGWHPWSLSVCITSVQDLLAFIVSIEKSGVILMGLPLYVTWPFSFAALNIFLYSVCLVV